MGKINKLKKKQIYQVFILMIGWGSVPVGRYLVDSQSSEGVVVCVLAWEVRGDVVGVLFQVVQGDVELVLF